MGCSHIVRIYALSHRKVLLKRWRACIDTLWHHVHSQSGMKSRGGGGYSSMICVGMCPWDLKSRPIICQILPKNETHFHTRATNFKLKMSHYVPKLLSFQANFWNFGIRLMKLGLFLCQFKKILKMWPMFIPVFALNKG